MASEIDVDLDPRLLDDDPVAFKQTVTRALTLYRCLNGELSVIDAADVLGEDAEAVLRWLGAVHRQARTAAASPVAEPPWPPTRTAASARPALTTTRRIEPPDVAEKRRRRDAWLAAHANDYAGRYIALDGDRLLGTGENYPEAVEAAKAAGIDPRQVFIDRVPVPGEEAFMSGFL
jgi:hypothetical protein